MTWSETIQRFCIIIGRFPKVLCGCDGSWDKWEIWFVTDLVERDFEGQWGCLNKATERPERAWNYAKLKCWLINMMSHMLCGACECEIFRLPWNNEHSEVSMDMRVEIRVKIWWGKYFLAHGVSFRYHCLRASKHFTDRVQPAPWCCKLFWDLSCLNKKFL